MKTLLIITLRQFETKKQVVMRKFFLLLSVIVSFALSAIAKETTGVFMEYHQRGNEESHAKVNRSLVQIPALEVVYDSDTQTIRITSPESQTVNVYIYDSNGAVVGYANSLNTTIQLPSAGSYTIYMEGSGWYGIGYIN